VKTYMVYVHDRRYSVPTLLLVNLANDQRAQAFARERLASSNFHTGVEIWDGDDMICNVAAPALAPLREAAVGAR
jgi:hypothetical protein